jgi:hypothetical protein
LGFEFRLVSHEVVVKPNWQWHSATGKKPTIGTGMQTTLRKAEDNVTHAMARENALKGGRATMDTQRTSALSLVLIA